MSERRWISRVEIAEIHEAIADNTLNGSMGSPLVALDHAIDHDKRARDIRATEKLDNPLGSRT